MDTGWKSPGTMASDPSVGTVNWNNPDEAKTSDNTYSSFRGLGESYYLKATNFGFAIPAGATIDGIEVHIERFATAADSVEDLLVKIVKADGNYGAENKALGGWWSIVESYFAYGGVADLWSEVWTPANINHVNFGVGLQASAANLIFGRVDHIKIKVYYTPLATDMKVNIADTFEDVDSIKINIGNVWKDVVKVQINIGDLWKDVFG